MKKLLLLVLIAAICQVSAAQQQKIVYPGYTSYWNPKTLIPDSVVYIAKPHAKNADRSAGFHATGGRLNENRDYAGSGYDQGHLCNASDENGNKIDEYNSFDQCNIFPQRPNCNRLTWLALENQVRVLAQKYGQVKVKVYWNGIDTFMGPTRWLYPCIAIKRSGIMGSMKNTQCPTRIRSIGIPTPIIRLNNSFLHWRTEPSAFAGGFFI